MGHQIVPEVFFFLSAVGFGALLSVCYDQLRVLRLLFPHSVPLVDAEDILFFLTAGVGFFGLLYLKNEGSMRWFAFVGCALGSLLYFRTLSPLVCAAEKAVLELLLFPVIWVLRWGKTGLQKRKKRLTIKGQKADAKGQNKAGKGAQGQKDEKR